MGNREFSRYEHKETITSSDTKVSTSFLDNVPTTSPIEISDEEIEQYAQQNAFNYYEFITGAKWYREQLKKKQS